MITLILTIGTMLQPPMQVDRALIYGLNLPFIYRQGAKQTVCTNPTVSWLGWTLTVSSANCKDDIFWSDLEKH